MTTESVDMHGGGRTFDAADPFFSVSVVLPFYNGHKFIESTLRSILAQTVAPLEVLVIDDGCPSPLQLPQDLADRVTVIRTPNQGASAARNFGAAQAKSRWIAFCDQDDLWLPAKLEKQLRLVASVPEIHFVLTDYAPTFDGSSPMRSHLSYAPQSFWQKEHHEAGFVVREPVVGKLSNFQPSITSTPIVLKDFFVKSGGFDSNVEWGAEDTCFHFRCLSVTPFGVVPEVLMLYRKHPDAGSADELVQLRKTAEVWKYIAQNYPEAKPYRAELLSGVDAIRQQIKEYERYARRQKLKRLLRMG